MITGGDDECGVVGYLLAGYNCVDNCVDLEDAEKLTVTSESDESLCTLL
jgi:hypothetical protein